ncbi:MAG: hypothetical protein HF975_06800 [ANME-2 cluster archaeon]|nr:hypothetical protein [ANME-2 cluster archaeon]MBC2746703.1 hypothetical protein [ANME-2 cluster archaeon]
MMMQKVGNGHSLWNLLNDNLAIRFTDKIENRDVEFYLQATVLKSGV